MGRLLPRTPGHPKHRHRRARRTPRVRVPAQLAAHRGRQRSAAPAGQILLHAGRRQGVERASRTVGIQQHGIPAGAPAHGDTRAGTRLRVRRSQPRRQQPPAHQRRIIQEHDRAHRPTHEDRRIRAPRLLRPMGQRHARLRDPIHARIHALAGETARQMGDDRPQ